MLCKADASCCAKELAESAELVLLLAEDVLMGVSKLNATGAAISGCLLNETMSNKLPPP